MNKKSITLHSEALKNIFLILENDTESTLLSQLNRNRSFLVYFNEPDIVYSQYNLFKDSKLLGNIDSFLGYFDTCLDLESVTSEKGSMLGASQRQFERGSMFRFIIDEFRSKYLSFICDDGSIEWTDFIGIGARKVTFYHAKYSESKYSASAFQEVIGQALKNLGNMRIDLAKADSKKPYWNKKYSNNTGTSGINRIVKGGSFSKVKKHLHAESMELNSERNVVVVINFISKSDLTSLLTQLKSGKKSFKGKKEAIQILWLISSFISACLEAGAKPQIICKP